MKKKINKESKMGYQDKAEEYQDMVEKELRIKEDIMATRKGYQEMKPGRSKRQEIQIKNMENKAPPMIKRKPLVGGKTSNLKPVGRQEMIGLRAPQEEEISPFGIYDGAFKYLTDDYSEFTKLGEGGFGLVVKAYNNLEERYDAIKIIRLGAISQAEVEFMLREITILIKCDHDYILKLHHSFKRTGWIFLIMKLCHTDLQNLLDKGDLDRTLAMGYICNVCDGVAYLHEKKIVHRDLKPLNVLMLAEHGVYIPKICDFGLAKNTTAGVTSQIFGIAGTLLYMPPEWVVPKKAEDRNSPTGDNWSIGVMIYQILEDEYPFEAESIGNIIEFAYRPLSKDNAHWDPFFKHIFCPKDSRWNSKEIKDQLLLMLDQHPIPKKQISPPAAIVSMISDPDAVTQPLTLPGNQPRTYIFIYIYIYKCFIQYWINFHRLIIFYSYF